MYFTTYSAWVINELHFVAEKNKIVFCLNTVLVLFYSLEAYLPIYFGVIYHLVKFRKIYAI